MQNTHSKRFLCICYLYGKRVEWRFEMYLMYVIIITSNLKVIADLVFVHMWSCEFWFLASHVILCVFFLYVECFFAALSVLGSLLREAFSFRARHCKAVWTFFWKLFLRGRWDGSMIDFVKKVRFIFLFVCENTCLRIFLLYVRSICILNESDSWCSNDLSDYYLNEKN